MADYDIDEKELVSNYVPLKDKKRQLVSIVSTTKIPSITFYCNSLLTKDRKTSKSLPAQEACTANNKLNRRG